MGKNKCIAMVLAGGRGERLGELTRFYAKPAVHFGRGNRIIDFTLNNCGESGIDTIGVLSQHMSNDLQMYVESYFSQAECPSRVFMLPPKTDEEIYSATADAIYKNLDFIERLHPKNVLILAGDHIYRMNYGPFIEFHEMNKADVTMAAKHVSMKDARRYGILGTDASGRVKTFEEKPNEPQSDLASMGIYLFRWETLKKHLQADRKKNNSHHDFGRDILPAVLASSDSLYSYTFNGYWKDVGTLDSFWEAHMDLLSSDSPVCPPAANSEDISAPYFVSSTARIDHVILSKCCTVFGRVKNSILSNSVTVESGAEIVDSVIMPHAYIGENARVYRTIVGTGAKIMNNAEIGADDGTSIFVDREVCRENISLIAPWLVIPRGIRVQKSSQINEEKLRIWEDAVLAASRMRYLEIISV